jgi:hypothetical protein
LLAGRPDVDIVAAIAQQYEPDPTFHRVSAVDGMSAPTSGAFVIPSPVPDTAHFLGSGRFVAVDVVSTALDGAAGVGYGVAAAFTHRCTPRRCFGGAVARRKGEETSTGGVSTSVVGGASTASAGRVDEDSVLIVPRPFVANERCFYRFNANCSSNRCQLALVLDRYFIAGGPERDSFLSVAESLNFDSFGRPPAKDRFWYFAANGTTIENKLRWSGGDTVDGVPIPGGITVRERQGFSVELRTLPAGMVAASDGFFGITIGTYARTATYTPTVSATATTSFTDTRTVSRTVSATQTASSSATRPSPSTSQTASLIISLSASQSTSLLSRGPSR